MANTKETILRTALELFNTEGSRSVTTNHIVKACNISPGNLYYHFKNKEEIIRVLYNQMVQAWDEELLKIETMDMETFARISVLSEVLFARYRFIHNELYALCQIDKKLARLNKERLQTRKIQTKVIFQALIKHENFEPLGESEIEFLADSIWMYSIFWLPYQEMVSEDEVPKVNLDAVNILIARFLVKKMD